MKKLFIYALLVTSFSCTAFAVSDIQILLGAQLDFTDCKKEEEHGGYGGYYGGYDDADEYNSSFFPGCMFGILNYNLWDVGKGVVSLGFMDCLTFAMGTQFTFDFCICPALGVSSKAVKLQLSPGFTFGVCTFDDDSYMPLGLYIDLQLKFLHAKRTSPVLGVRYDYNILEGHEGGEDNRFGIYLALSVNIGNKKHNKLGTLYGSGAVREGSIIRKGVIGK